EFYPYSLRVLQEQNTKTQFTPKGVGVVIAPWNFPVGISVGTIAAPLAAGNRVIYKPSSLSSVTGYKLCECFWDAGVPRDALIYLPSKGSDISEYLLKDESIQFAILTGGEDTAYKMLEANPTLALSAETGGKNATIVSKMADRDQAIKNVIHSAFSNSGQKCSATSLLVLEKEVYEDENFKKTLIDATLSLSVGDPFDFKNKIG
ncbi:aldehyde dehydrogenase family protein, partial [Helicobacter pylori]